MDQSLYKTHTASRGIKYKYYFSPAKDGQRTILFLHGYPSTSDDWNKQVSFLTQQGYGVLVPDMLGYGGTDKPPKEDLEKYKPTLIAQDMIDLLEHEKVGRAVSIGHDWGSMANSRVAQLHSDRFDGFGYLALGYMPPNPDFEIHKANAMTKERLGWECLGYQIMQAEPDAAELIETHWDSYFSLLFPSNPEMWKSNLGPVGSIREWLVADRRSELPSYLTEADKKRLTKALLGQGGMKAPLLWYNLTVEGLRAKDDADIPKENYMINKPVFLGAAIKDYICVAPVQMMNAQKFCPQLTVKQYDGDHWIMWSHADQLNSDLSTWLERLPNGKAVL